MTESTATAQGEPPHSFATEEFGLPQLKCDGVVLYRLNSQGQRVAAVQLTEVKNLEFKRPIPKARIAGALLLLALSAISYLSITPTWLQWPVTGTLLFLLFGMTLGLRDKYVQVTTKNSSFRLDVDDSTSDKDIEAFIATVFAYVKEWRLRAMYSE